MALDVLLNLWTVLHAGQVVPLPVFPVSCLDEGTTTATAASARFLQLLLDTHATF
jgi:hypothetical protein